jgi:predicted PolB exonuclease-like 3'-5' exonuclease
LRLAKQLDAAQIPPMLAAMIFFDCETAGGDWSKLDAETQRLWGIFIGRRYSVELESKSAKGVWDDKVGLHPEFARVVCISVAVDDGPVVTIADDDERTLLEKFAKGLATKTGQGMVAHNIEFDSSFVGRRMIINGVKIPEVMRDFDRKPWERLSVDTQALFACGQFNYRIRLELLAHLLGVESPKGAMDGSEVGQYWRDGRIKEIAEYCERDVVCLREVYKKLTA